MYICVQTVYKPAAYNYARSWIFVRFEEYTTISSHINTVLSEEWEIQNATHSPERTLNEKSKMIKLPSAMLCPISTHRYPLLILDNDGIYVLYWSNKYFIRFFVLQTRSEGSNSHYEITQKITIHTHICAHVIVIKRKSKYTCACACFFHQLAITNNHDIQ